jgi:uncharacterized protein YraI
VVFTVRVRVGAVNLRGGPGSGYNVVGYGVQGDPFEVVGRNAGEDWLVVRLEKDQMGWISLSSVEHDFDVSKLPIIQAPPTPYVKPSSTKESDSGNGPGPAPTWTEPAG